MLIVRWMNSNVTYKLQFFQVKVSYIDQVEVRFVEIQSESTRKFLTPVKKNRSRMTKFIPR